MKYMLLFICSLLLNGLYAQTMPDCEAGNPKIVEGLSCSSNVFCSGTPSGGCSRNEYYQINIGAEGVELFAGFYEEKAIRASLRLKKGSIVKINVNSYTPYNGARVMQGLSDVVEYPAPAVSIREDIVYISFNDSHPPFTYSYQGKTYCIEFPPCMEKMSCAP